MFGKIPSISLYTVLVLCASVCLSWAVPVQVRSGFRLVARQQIEPVVTGAQVAPVLVDLLDQVQNLQQQFDAASEPLRSQIQQELAETKATLEQKMLGIAVYVSASEPPPATFLPTTTPAAPSSTLSASPSTVTAPPPSTASASAPVVTVVTQEGSAIVILASQGVTSTVSLETRTAVPSASGTTTNAPASSASTPPGTTTAPEPTITTPASSSTVTTPTTSASSLATAANASAQDRASAGAMQLVPSSLSLNMVLGAVALGDRVQGRVTSTSRRKGCVLPIFILSSMVYSQSSAAGVLALLQEPDSTFKQHALKALISLVPQFWAEISEHIATIEELYEADQLPKPARAAAALVASKVYYFLGEYDEALSFALGAGDAFFAETRTYGSEEYVETIVSKAIDRYIAVRSVEHAGSKDKIDPRLQFTIEGIFGRCISEGEFKQAIGIALESHRLDVISSIYSQTKDVSILTYAMEGVLNTGFSLSYRDEVLRFLFPLFPRPTTGDGSPHVHALTRLLVTLSDISLTIPLLTTLVVSEELLAYQLAFDLVEGGSQDFLETLRTQLPQGDEKSQPVYDKLRNILTGKESVKFYREFLKRNNQTDLLILKNTKDVLEPRSSIYHTALTLQNAFMHAGTTSDVFLRDNLEWLGLASNWSKFSATAGLGVIHKGYFEQGQTILGPYLPQSGGESNVPGANYQEGGALYALGLVNAGCGSSITTYLRDSLKAAQNEVVQHGAALGLGVSGMGSKSLEAFEDLKNILFTDSAVAGEASGYAMGLVMLGTAAAEPVREMLQYARDTQHEKIIRGLAMGTAFVYYGRQEEADETIKLLLAEKDPILRYGGVYTLALAYAGTANNDAVRKLLHIAVSDTSDDVRRAAVTSLSFLLFKNPGQVPRVVQLLSESYNPHVRCGATLALGIACAGTGLQDAVEILEPMTKDSVDFVRQGAFIALGMILVEQSEASSPAIAPTRAKYAKVISDKHEDPMARFGAAIGQGFIDAGGRNVTINLQSRAGSTNTSAIVGMVLFCQFWYWYPLAHCACLAFSPTGIIGLNGDLKAPKFEYISNAKPSLFAYPSSTKPPKKEAVTKVATAVLSTTAKVKAREKKKAAAEGENMDLDTKTEADGDVEMKTEVGSPKDGDVSPIIQSVSNLAEESKPSTSRKKLESTFETRPNFSRVTPAQLSYISFPSDGRYQPVRAVSTRTPSKNGKAAATTALGLGSEKYAGGGGILILTDLRPNEEAEYIELETAPSVPPPAPPVDVPGNGHAVGAPTGRHIALDESAPEAEPPEAFEYPFDNDT
ncbi:unnamed protein product [Cyclocybe aegerita]|uniref:26S proteasome regulatory subunit RPN2 n=1 Tax=Cyclocybe aegerita TaxID=1973307 RepID=A0A8S0XJT0_CYCAE|nr:unnamed protein product [Cyclocybe aegerita]